MFVVQVAGNPAGVLWKLYHPGLCSVCCGGKRFNQRSPSGIVCILCTAGLNGIQHSCCFLIDLHITPTLNIKVIEVNVLETH